MWFSARKWTVVRNMSGFWLLGLCNNFAFAIMLSAAEDIINRHSTGNVSLSDDQCTQKLTSRPCSTISTGSVLLADILPTFFVKLTFPFFIHRVPYGVRHLLVVLFQAASFLIVAFSSSVELSLIGVAIASCSSGLGEITYLALSSHFKGHTISAFASGTGAAGILSAFSYAALTEPYLADISPRTTLLVMLIVPVVFAVCYWIVIELPSSVHRVNLLHFRTFIAPKARRTIDAEKSVQSTGKEIVNRSPSSIGCGERLRLILPLLRFMIPLFAVYYGEYLINQGIVQMIIFECSKGWNLSASSQYRWYQVLYQMGVFISRTSVFLFKIPAGVLPFLAVLQLCNAGFALTEAIYAYVPHISIVFAVILYEGLLGGATYANAFRAIHATAPPETREYSMTVASVADSSGIVSAAFSTIPIHNFVCSQAMR